MRYLQTSQSLSIVVRSTGFAHCAPLILNGMLRLTLATIFCVNALLAQKIDTEFDHALDFSKFKTFSIASGRVNAKSPMLNSELAEKNLKTAIVAQLKAKGLTEAEGKGDLTVTFRLTDGTQKQSMRVANDNVGMVRGRNSTINPGRTTSTRRETYTQAKDTLVIDIKDGSTKELAWRAVCVDTQADPAKLEKRLPTLVTKAFQKFPPKKK